MMEEPPGHDARQETPQTSAFSPMFRLASYIAAVIIAMIAAGMILLLTNANLDLTSGKKLPLFATAIVETLIALAVVPITLFFVKYLDKRPVDTFGFAKRGTWGRELRLGIALGCIFQLLIFGVSYYAGWIKITGSLFDEPLSRVAGVMIGTLVLMISVAVLEETIFRGYILQTLEERFGPVSALIVSSLVFGLIHLLNPGATFAAFLGTLAAGLFIGYTYLVTRRLWLPIGFHFAWNFVQGPILGFPVSGIDIAGWIQQKTVNMPVWLGGEFGPEAGLFDIFVLLLGTIIVWRFAKTAYRPN